MTRDDATEKVLEMLGIDSKSGMTTALIQPTDERWYYVRKENKRKMYPCFGDNVRTGTIADAEEGDPSDVVVEVTVPEEASGDYEVRKIHG